MERADYLERSMAQEFDVETEKKWREGNQRTCFNYFLLDPRVTQNLPQRVSQVTNEQAFLTFLDALFYVGKGTRGRPYSHLFEAVKTIKNDRPVRILYLYIFFFSPTEKLNLKIGFY